MSLTMAEPVGIPTVADAKMYNILFQDHGQAWLKRYFSQSKETSSICKVMPPTHEECFQKQEPQKVWNKSLFTKICS